MKTVLFVLMLAFVILSGMAFATTAKLYVNFGSTTGMINVDLCGVNHGVLAVNTPDERYDGSNGVDLSKEYNWCGVKWIRTDEIASGEILSIFPSGETGDVNDPSLYHFEKIDSYLAPCIKNGNRIIFRLGYSTKVHHTDTWYWDPPADFNRYSTICRNIYKHLCENSFGPNGHTWPIAYWEFFNEPDQGGGKVWTGTPTQFAQLYQAVATALRAESSTVKIGAYGAANSTNEPGSFLDTFLTYCHANSVPLDFFSWHTYPFYGSHLGEHASVIRKALDKHGFTKAENINTEWASATQTNNDTAAEACFIVSSLIMAQNSPLDIACYYSGSPYAGSIYGMWNPASNPVDARKKGTYGFKSYSMLAYYTHIMCKTSGPADMTPPLAGKNSTATKARILITNYFCDKYGDFDIKVSNLPFSNWKYTYYVVDSTHNLTASTPVNGSGRSFTKTMTNVSQPCIYVLEFTKL